MCKFEVGDKVTIKAYTEVMDHWCINPLTWLLYEVIEEPFTISQIDDDGSCLLKEDVLSLWWPLDGLELYGEESDELPLYNGRVVCVDNSVNPRAYTIGKIYQFVNGQFVDDCGNKVPNFPKARGIYTFDAWKNLSGAKWLEIVE